MRPTLADQVVHDVEHSQVVVTVVDNVSQEQDVSIPFKGVIDNWLKLASITVNVANHNNVLMVVKLAGNILLFNNV